MRSKSAILLAMLALSALAFSVSTEANARQLTADEVRAMYADKSWAWGNGNAGYFRADGGFWAWTTGSYGEGIWKTNNQGMLCFSAFWTSKAGRFPARSCFAHRMDERGDIFQRKIPDGAWYLFEHAKPQPDDASAGLVRGNLVLDKFVALRKQQAAQPAAMEMEGEE